jgi:Xaa-Pro aminopeptidase
MFDLSAIQNALQSMQIDGWLLYDFRASNVLARRVLDLQQRPDGTRRLFYFVPAVGEPQKLVHRIESGALDHLPGRKQVYLRWQELEAGLVEILKGSRTVAMEYSPRSAIPYISKVEAGIVELVAGSGVQVVPSGDLVQLFEATWDDRQWQMHLEAARHTSSAYDRAFGLIADRVRSGGSVLESEVQRVILDHFREHKLVTSHPPIVAVGPHSGDPHYETTPATDAEMREGDFVLIDLWAKLDQPGSVYSDLTRVGFIGQQVPTRYEQVFQIVAQARDAAILVVQQAFARGDMLYGWQVDRAARQVIEQAGYGDQFVHRTGHSIGQETHGNGTNMDDLETHDERRVLPRTCFSIEPGIYLEDFGVRSEVNVFIDAQNTVHVTGGPPQRTVLPILAATTAQS